MAGRENPAQNGDRFSLAESLAAMSRLGTSEEYRAGYEHGFEAAPFSPPSWDTYSDTYVAYARGRRYGRQAYWRGAHGAFDRLEWGGEA